MEITVGQMVTGRIEYDLCSSQSPAYTPSPLISQGGTEPLGFSRGLTPHEGPRFVTRFTACHVKHETAVKHCPAPAGESA